MLKRAKMLKKHYEDSIKTPFLQEILWFYGMGEAQDSELCVLEFFNICSSHAKQKRLFDPKLKTASYRTDIELRTILYNFPELESIANSSMQESEKWNKIIEVLEKKSDIAYSYGYLRDRFEGVSLFFDSVLLLRKASLDIDGPTKWGTKFLFPFSFNTSFVALDIVQKKSFVRRSRVGEILYIMISRAKNAKVLKELMMETYDNSPQSRRWNLLLDTLRGRKKSSTHKIKLSLLDTHLHPVFDQMVDDLIALLRTNIPRNDIFDHFVSICSFYMVHFILQVAKQSMRDSDTKILYPIELLSHSSDHVRKSSRQAYKLNEDLPLEAIKVVFENYMSGLEHITNKQKLLTKLEAELNYKDERDNEGKSIEFKKLKTKIFKLISDKAKSDIPIIHKTFLKTAGLASIYKTNSYRYLASDNTLKTLVLINIDTRLSFNEFLDKLYDKYGFILSSRHSTKLKENYTQNDYKKNEQRLFHRLKELGLLESRSDGYAYVLNRYGRREG